MYTNDINTQNPSKRPTKAPTTKEPTLKANTGNEPTTGNGQAQDTPTTSPTQPAGAKGADEEESAVLNTTTLIIIGSSVGVCIICILVLLLLVCHRRNKLLNQALNKTISQAEMIDVTASRMGATTNGTTNMPTHYPLNSQSPMVSNSGEIQNYDGRNTGVVPHDDEKDNELIRVVSSSDNVGEMALSEGSNQFRQGTVNSNAASVFLNGSYMNENDSDDNEDNDDLYKKATKGGPMNYQTAGGNDDIVTNGAPPKIISNGNNESSEDEDNGMYGKGNNSSKGGTVGGSEWNSFRASD